MKYFDLKEAWRDLTFAYEVHGVKDVDGITETVAKSGKLIGKLAANTVLLGAEIGAEIIKDLPNQMEKQTERLVKQAEQQLEQPDLPTEKREKLQEYVNNHKKSD